MEREVYMDYAATTYIKPEVIKEMNPYLTEYFGNPSSIYHISRKTKGAIDAARQRIATAIKARRDEIFFTSGGSEADNWAIKGVVFANKDRGNHIITTKIEHHAVLHTCEYLEELGFEITYLPVDEFGFVKIEDLKKAITDKTILVSIMFANNEIGTIQSIMEIGELCREKRVIFHTDAVQAVGNVPIDVTAMNIDLLSMASHKFYGPKGMGALYIKKGIKIHNLIHGGAQERARRAGTENIAGIVGMGKAVELATENMENESKRLTILRDKLIQGLLKIPGTRLNGPSGEKRLPGNVNISFEGAAGDILLMRLDSMGICASSGSACSAGALEPSHVLIALGLPEERAKNSLRLTIGSGTTEEEIDYVLKVITEMAM
ncbi:cysteine desulfurase NifS [Clostridium sp. A1-XYC3]|uniref:Cysteine desulfurase n=1 Tax=Clostridium tanneri TaxID=3037988 RepID=A0ABU4JR07_9CLOT|nr:cysteine desulfurase NifS [Clostridium sp. A1-XYC3]MDW8800578.1 cysteine desulfurase NifS [Clostridium sp. A1-XYC3]